MAAPRDPLRPAAFGRFRVGATGGAVPPVDDMDGQFVVTEDNETFVEAEDGAFVTWGDD